MQAFAFRAQYNGAVHLVVHAVVGLPATLVEANRPEVFGFEFFNCAGDVSDLGNREMFAGSGGNFGNSPGDPGSPPFWNHHAVGACRIGSAKNRAEIMWILHAIKNDDERMRAAFAG